MWLCACKICRKSVTGTPVSRPSFILFSFTTIILGALGVESPHGGAIGGVEEFNRHVRAFATELFGKSMFGEAGRLPLSQLSSFDSASAVVLGQSGIPGNVPLEGHSESE